MSDSAADPKAPEIIEARTASRAIRRGSPKRFPLKMLLTGAISSREEMAQERRQRSSPIIQCGLKMATAAAGRAATPRIISVLF